MFFLLHNEAPYFHSPYNILNFLFDGSFYAIELQDLETSDNSKGVDGANDLLTLLPWLEKKKLKKKLFGTFNGTIMTQIKKFKHNWFCKPQNNKSNHYAKMWLYYYTYHYVWNNIGHILLNHYVLKSYMWFMPLVLILVIIVFTISHVMVITTMTFIISVGKCH